MTILFALGRMCVVSNFVKIYEIFQPLAKKLNISYLFRVIENDIIKQTGVIAPPEVCSRPGESEKYMKA